jgi:filamentous hemagglutinin family protein
MFINTESFNINNSKILFPFSLTLVGILAMEIPVEAQVSTQVTIDNTAGTSFVCLNGNCDITGGTTVNTTALFQSFQNFSVGTNNTVTFNHSPNITDIFARVTGGLPSIIDGTLATQGSANLFLINPSGIIFGQNAKLNVGGSFVASTAESILFANNQQFSAVNPQNPSLLTVNIPLGLQMGVTSQNINVNAQGTNPPPPAFDYEPFLKTGLEVPTGKTLALVGNGVSFNNGVAVAPEGRIELWSVNNSQVNLSSNNGQLQLSQASIPPNLSNLSLDNNSALITSGNSSGNIHLVGNNIVINNGSQILSDTLGDGSSGSVFVEANLLTLANGGQISSSAEFFSEGNAGELNVKAQTLEITGSETSVNPTGLFAGVAPGATGAGGNIVVDTNNLFLSNGGQIITTTFGFGKAGSLDITAQNITVTGGTEINPSVISASVEQIPEQVFLDFGFPPFLIPDLGLGEGDGGNVNIKTSNLTVSNGGQVSAFTNGSGAGGNLTVNANNINLTGFNEQGKSGLLANAFQGTGNGGDISVTASQSLTIDNQALISVSNFQSKGLLPPGSGTAGNITINTPNLQLNNQGTITADTRTGDKGNINITSSILALANNSRISTNATENGQGGSINLNTGSLNLVQSQITANGAVGSAGNITISANQSQGINLNQSQIKANGGQGNITLASPLMIMRNGSLVSTNGLGTFEGGNININTDILVALENSDISANAQNSFGGRVVINAKSIFGTKFREANTAESDITATSELGSQFSGTVEINSPEITPDVIEEAPQSFQPPDLIASGCTGDVGNVFVKTGRGGLPETLNQGLNGRVVWHDLRSAQEISPQTNSISKTNPETETIIQAQGWVMKENNQIELVSQMPQVNYQLSDHDYKCN